MSVDTQLALTLDTGRARRGDAPTAVAAAAAVDVPRRCAEVLEVLDAPTTAAELADTLQRRGHRWAQVGTVSRRLLDLERRNLARRCGEVVGPFGRMVLVYEAVS